MLSEDQVLNIPLAEKRGVSEKHLWNGAIEHLIANSWIPPFEICFIFLDCVTNRRFLNLVKETLFKRY